MKTKTPASSHNAAAASKIKNTAPLLSLSSLPEIGQPPSQCTSGILGAGGRNLAAKERGLHHRTGRPGAGLRPCGVPLPLARPCPPAPICLYVASCPLGAGAASLTRVISGVQFVTSKGDWVLLCLRQKAGYRASLWAASEGLARWLVPATRWSEDLSLASWHLARPCSTSARTTWTGPRCGEGLPMEH
jgi:hypothetical protein